MKTALIGCGKVGHLHAAALSELSQFTAVCDHAAPRAAAFAAQYGATAYPDVPALLAAGVEAVVVCTPHPLHAAPTVAALERGIHVLVEKPLAATVEDCDLMLAAAARSGARLGVVSQRRFFEPVLAMKAAVQEGKIGTPILGTVAMFSWRDEAYYRSDPWRGKWSTEGGGVLINQAPHHLDILQWLMGPVQSVSGIASNLNHPYIEVEDTAIANIRFTNGGLGNIVCSLSQNPGIHTKIHIHGSNGYSVGAQTDGGATFIAGMTGTILEPAYNDLWTIPGESAPTYAAPADPISHYHRLQVQDFLQAIAESRPFVSPAEDGRKVVDMIRRIYASTIES